MAALLGAATIVSDEGLVAASTANTGDDGDCSG